MNARILSICNIIDDLRTSSSSDSNLKHELFVIQWLLFSLDNERAVSKLKLIVNKERYLFTREFDLRFKEEKKLAILSAIYYAVSLLLAELSPINKVDFATLDELENISLDRRIYTSDGYFFDIQSLRSWGKMINPSTKQPFNKKDEARIQVAIDELRKNDQVNKAVEVGSDEEMTYSEVAHIVLTDYLLENDDLSVRDILVPIFYYPSVSGPARMQTMPLQVTERRFTMFSAPSPISLFPSNMPVREIPSWLSNELVVHLEDNLWAVVEKACISKEIIIIDAITNHAVRTIKDIHDEPISALVVRREVDVDIANGPVLIVGHYYDNTTLNFINSRTGEDLMQIPQLSGIGFRCLLEHDDGIIYFERMYNSHLTAIDSSCVVRQISVTQLKEIIVNGEKIIGVFDNYCSIYDLQLNLLQHFSVAVVPRFIACVGDNIIFSDNQQTCIYKQNGQFLKEIRHDDMGLIYSIVPTTNHHFLITDASRIVREYDLEGNVIQQARLSSSIWGPAALTYTYEHLRERNEFENSGATTFVLR